MRCCVQLPHRIAAIQPGLEPSLSSREIQGRSWPDAAPQYFVVRNPHLWQSSPVTEGGLRPRPREEVLPNSPSAMSKPEIQTYVRVLAAPSEAPAGRSGGN